MRGDVFEHIMVINKQFVIFAIIILANFSSLQVIIYLTFDLTIVYFICCVFILGYDRYIKLWDTETGQVVKRFSSRKIPYCIKFNPDKNKQHLFVAGTSDKKIICVSILAENIRLTFSRLIFIFFSVVYNVFICLRLLRLFRIDTNLVFFYNNSNIPNLPKLT